MRQGWLEQVFRQGEDKKAGNYDGAHDCNGNGIALDSDRIAKGQPVTNSPAHMNDSAGSAGKPLVSATGKGKTECSGYYQSRNNKYAQTGRCYLKGKGCYFKGMHD